MPPMELVRADSEQNKSMVSDDVWFLILKECDFMTLLAFRQSSKDCLALVNQTPVVLTRIALTPFKDDYCRLVIEDNGKEYRISDKTAKAIRQLILIFTHKKSYCMEFNFGLPYDPQPRNDNPFMQQLARGLSEAGVQLRTKKFYWLWEDNTARMCLDALKLCDTKVLEAISITPSFEDDDFSQQLAETEQWKAAKSFYRLRKSIDRVERYLHATKLRFCVFRVTIQSVAMVLNSFIRRSVPLSSYFLVLGDTPQELEDHLAEYAHVGAPHRITNPENMVTYKFKLSDNDHVLVLKVRQNRLEGCVCRIGHVGLDYNVPLLEY